MSGNKSLKPPLCNYKGEQDGAIFLLKFKAWGGTQDMGALFDANFEATLPYTKATVLNLGSDDEKKKDNTRKLNTV